MSYPSSTSAPFLSIVQAWIETAGEVLVLIRYHASAGAKEFEFFGVMSAFQGRLAALPPRTCITVFRDKQLPVRGAANPELASVALARIPDGEEWLAVTLRPTVLGKWSWFHHAAGETHAELREELDSHYGELTAIGPYPP